MLAHLSIEKQEQDLKEIELDIRLFTKGEWRALGYVRRVFYYLRENIELCEQAEWKRLYDECVYYQILDARLNIEWTEISFDEQRKYIEFLADLAIKRNNAACRFSKKEVEKYLEYRKTEWDI